MSHPNRRHKWSFKYRAIRFLWTIVWLFLFRPTPKRLGRNWRNFLLKLFGATISNSSLICPSCRILEPWNLDIGPRVAIGERVDLYNYARITVGSDSVISQDSILCTGTHDYRYAHMPLISKPIVIGENVWITSRCFIHPGVTIGDGCVVGACSVVTKNLPEWMVYSGNPAVPIKPRRIISP